MTMAALLHRDRQGTLVAAALVERSGMAPAPGCGACSRPLLPPLLHVLYRYGTAFSPHGENAILVFTATTSPPAWPSRTSSTTST